VDKKERERKRLKFNPPPPPFQSGSAMWLSYPRSELAEILEPRVHKKTSMRNLMGTNSLYIYI
jgi:hypothetical protein